MPLMLDPHRTALILIGFQNDYFANEGVLHAVIEESTRVTRVIDNTVRVLERLETTPVTFISTPIFFTEDYSELVDPVGILKTIRDVGAFRAGSSGSEPIPEMRRFGERIITVPGKRGLNAFSNTDLDGELQRRGIRNLVFAGAVTSICIDSTGRSAHERGYRVTVLSDCTSARTLYEQSFYCEQIFPLYAHVCTHHELLDEMGVE